MRNGSDVEMTCDGSDFQDFDKFDESSSDTNKIITWHRIVRSDTHEDDVIWRHEASQDRIIKDLAQSKNQVRVELVHSGTLKAKYHKIKLVNVDLQDFGHYWCTIQWKGYSLASNRKKLAVLRIGEKIKKYNPFGIAGKCLMFLAVRYQ